MKLNVEKQSNNAFVKMECELCLDIFSADEKYTYSLTGSGEVICYQCGEQTEKEIISRLEQKIAYLQDSIKKMN